MKCPICGSEMREGGLLVDGILVRWVPTETFGRSAIKRIALTGNKILKHETNHIMRQTKLPGAHYCEACDKIVGIFDVTE